MLHGWNSRRLLDDSFRALREHRCWSKPGAAADGKPSAALEGDAVLLRQAFINLIKNPYEAMNDGGTLAVSAQVDKGDGAKSQGRKYVRLEFKDTGHGLRPIHRRENFYPVLHYQVQGTGLGLALVQKIIVYHGGRVTGKDVRNRAERYFRFIFR